MLLSLETGNGRPDIDRLMSEHGNHLLRLCFLMLKDYHLAQDALQETFIRVYIKYSSYRGESSERTWITSIAVNICRDYLKKRPRREAPLDLADYISGDVSCEYTEVLYEVYRLPEDYRQVILMRYYEEMSVKDIAAALGEKENTVSVRLKRAKDMLRCELTEADYERV